MGTPEKMAKPKSLTPLAISNLKPRPKDEPKRYEISDPGCVGLRVVVFPSGQKSYIVRYRFRGVQRKLTLGRCLGQENGEGDPAEAPELATPLSLAAARELATKALRQARSGSDPAAAKAKKRQEQRAAESDTLGAIAQEYLRRKEPQRADNQLRSDLDLLGVTLGRLHVRELTRGRTTIVISHRFPTVRLSDRILVLEKGRIVEEGSHDALVEKDGRYAKMFELQAAGYR